MKKQLNSAGVTFVYYNAMLTQNKHISEFNYK